MKRNFISITILESSASDVFLSATFAPLAGDKPRAITNKTKKGPRKPFNLKPGNSLAFNHGILIFLMFMISCASPAKNPREKDSAEGTLAAQLWTFRYDLE